MKNNLLCFSIILLGISLIISSIILSRSKIEQIQSINSSMNGTFAVNQSTYEGADYNSGDIISIYTASSLLLYETPEQLKQDIEDGNKEDIPYVFINGNYIFSKKALEEWVYSKSIK